MQAITVNNIKNTNSERYELRIELRGGSPCHCVAPIGSFGLVEEWNNGDALCNASVSSPYVLCASNSQYVVYSTKRFKISNGQVTGNDDNCDEQSGEDMNHAPTLCPDSSTVSPLTTTSSIVESSLSSTSSSTPKITQAFNSTPLLSSTPLSSVVVFTRADQFMNSTTAIVIPSSIESFGIPSIVTENLSPTSTIESTIVLAATALSSIQSISSTSFLSETPTPEIFCPEDGIWERTKACTSTTLQVCSPDLKING